jgi:hypothetical protein
MDQPSIAGLDGLRERFGHWPQFHDSEILRIVLDRKGPTATFELLAQAKGEPGQPQFRVDLRFDVIANLAIDDFNHQNVVTELTVDPVQEERWVEGKLEDRLTVKFYSVFGAECTFTCASGQVLNVEGAPRPTAPLPI